MRRKLKRPCEHLSNRYLLMVFGTLFLMSSGLWFINASKPRSSIDERDIRNHSCYPDSSSNLPFTNITQMLGLEALRNLNATNQSTIAILDTGINLSHPFFSKFGNLTNDSFYWEDGRFLIDGDGSLTPIDIGGHGTHISSIVNEINPEIGQSLRMVIMNVFQNLSGSPSISLDDLSILINHVSSFSGNRSPDIISLSLGSDFPITSYDAATNAVDSCRDKNIIVVCSAGNSGSRTTGSIYSPGISNWSITVGSIETYNKRYSMGSVGPVFNGKIKPDIVAPGVSIAGADAKTGGIKYMSGTSQSTAIISGALSLLKSRFPELNATEIKKILYLCSVKLPIPESDGDFITPDNYQGYGIPQFDVFASLMSSSQYITFPQNIVLNTSLGTGSAWVRKVHLEKGKMYGFSMKLKSGGSNVKMALYADQPDEFGYPIVLRTSSNVMKNVIYPSTADQDVFLVVKGDLSVPGSQYALTIDLIPDESLTYQQYIALLITVCYIIGLFAVINKEFLKKSQ